MPVSKIEWKAPASAKTSLKFHYAFVTRGASVPGQRPVTTMAFLTLEVVKNDRIIAFMGLIATGRDMKEWYATERRIELHSIHVRWAGRPSNERIEQDRLRLKPIPLPESVA